MRTENLLCPDRSACNSQADPLAAHNAAYEQHLTDGGYAAGYAKCCKGGVAHLSRWMGFTHKKVSEVSEVLIAEFLDIHLPRCACGSVIHDRGSLNGALGHLLVALRATGVIPPRAVDRTPIDEELQCYDQYMVEVRNLAPSTRKDALRIVRCLLHSRFGDGCIDFAAIGTEHVRCFFAQQAKLHKKSASIGMVVASLRGYFRWRATLGDQVHALVGSWLIRRIGNLHRKRSANPSIHPNLKLRTLRPLQRQVRCGDHGSRAVGVVFGAGAGLPGLWPEGQGMGPGQWGVAAVIAELVRARRALAGAAGRC